MGRTSIVRAVLRAVSARALHAIACLKYGMAMRRGIRFVHGLRSDGSNMLAISHRKV